MTALIFAAILVAVVVFLWKVLRVIERQVMMPVAELIRRLAPQIEQLTLRSEFAERALREKTAECESLREMLDELHVRI